MTISLRQFKQVSMTGTSPITANFTSPVLAGSLLLVIGGNWGNATQPTLTVSDSINGAWPLNPTQGAFATSGDRQNAAVCGFALTAAGNPTLTINNPASAGNAFFGGVICEFTTTQAWANLVDGQAGNQNFTPTAQPSAGPTGAINSSGLQALVVGCAASSKSTITNTSNGFNTPSGFTSIVLQNTSAVDEAFSSDWEVVTASGQTITASWGPNLITGANWAATIAVFKEVAGAAPAINQTDASKRNRPGRGPQSKGRMYVRSVDAFTKLTQISGASSITLGALTASSTATLALSASSAPTLGNATLSSAAVLAIAGALANTLGNATISSASTLALAGALSSTLGNVTLSSVSVLALAGALAVTLGDVTLSSAAALAIVGAAGITLGGATLSSAATLALSGAVGIALGNATLSSAGMLASAGALSSTLGNVTLSSAAVLALAGVLTSTLGPVTLSSAGTIALSGQAAITLGNATLSSAAAIALTGALAATLGAVTLSSDGVGITTISGALSVTLDPLSLSSAGVVAISGAAGVTLAALTLLAGGTVTIAGAGDITLGVLTLSSAGTIDSGGGGGDCPTIEQIWAFVLPTGMTAADTLSALARIHGLVIGEQLQVSPTSRTAGPIAQTVSTDGSGTVTVDRTV